MNKTEELYAQVLELQKHAGEILRWDFEPEKLRLADKTFYTPDFRVILPEGTVEFHEVKGFWRDDARVKIKVAAELHPYIFRVAICNKGKWTFETI
jgi:hypothetical protein